ncbi:MAG: sugar phosphate isomerase/epimerase [Rubrobacteraceae bacterium]|uniref:sugar phosphate isomerase/epimerase family protein n=1 Tax=Rubrobacter naiadicus TaxID=1392641 RepID=UPI002361733D|nr:sugar phosphate isomerase/epimerase family protein [Rubrobacter naiadicus]MBX6762574.1 sugar phosphate isomerase/epimerase [Rubrobacteraceae bacterium]MCL6438732.1 sugar phosphate isomerase/epimerase [Rubrobacteraceae bacterium]
MMLVGINLEGCFMVGCEELSGAVSELWEAEPDFIEVAPHLLGVILGGRLEETRVEEVRRVLLETGPSYTVHAPHRINLMSSDPVERELHLEVLKSSVRFASEIGARVVVCHAGLRRNARDGGVSLDEQLEGERRALAEAGDLAQSLRVTIAVENTYPEPSLLRGDLYAYAVRPSALAAQLAVLDHPAVRMCLDVGHAAIAASAYGFDLVGECRAAAPMVHHVHLHDNFGVPDYHAEPLVSERWALGRGDLHLPPGRGRLPLSEVLRALEPRGGHTCCVELAPPARPAVRPALRAARELVRRKAAPVA